MYLHTRKIVCCIQIQCILFIRDDPSTVQARADASAAMRRGELASLVGLGCTRLHARSGLRGEDCPGLICNRLHHCHLLSNICLRFRNLISSIIRGTVRAKLQPWLLYALLLQIPYANLQDRVCITPDCGHLVKEDFALESDILLNPSSNSNSCMRFPLAYFLRNIQRTSDTNPRKHYPEMATSSCCFDSPLLQCGMVVYTCTLLIYAVHMSMSSGQVPRAIPQDVPRPGHARGAV